LKSKIVATLLLFVFVVSTISAVSMTNVNVQAQTQISGTIKTYPIADAIPNPIGVGESTLIKMGISQPAPSASYGWTGITVSIIKPDGTTETLGPFTTDSTGSTYTRYTPTQIGNYTITTNVPNQTWPITFLDSERGATIQAGTILLANNATTILEVTSEPVQQVYPGHALPTEYWSRPIDPQLREWFSISGNWVARPDNSLALYNDYAPETAHVLWAKTYSLGGLTGGLLGDPEQIPAAYYAGDAYEGKFSNSVIISGILYYNTAPAGTYAQVGINGIQAVDLHTGQNLWFLNGTSLSFGQTLFFPSYNVNGVFSYLWSVTGSNYTAYSPYDGSWQYMYYNVPSGTRVFGPNGEILIYQINTAAGWMALWNSTLAGQQNDVIGTPSYGSWSFGVLGLTNTTNAAGSPNGNSATTNQIGQQINTGNQALRQRYLDGSLAKDYSWNVTIPKGLVARAELGSSAIKVYYNDRICGMDYNESMVRIWALPINAITTTRTADPAAMTSAQQSITTIYDKTWAAPAEWLSGSNTIHYTGATNYVSDPVYGNGVMAVFDKELRTHYGFSVVDGSYLWATEPENYLDQYGWGNAEHTWYFAYGKLYSVGIAGILYAYDLSTGKTAWTYTLSDPYGEPVTGENWWGWIDLIADGKIYIGTLEHSANNPIPRGGPYACVNATDGSQIWRVNGMFRETRWGGNPIIGDSIIASLDTYDNRVYAIGKGPVQVTANAPDLSVTFGTNVMIKGTVTDISPGINDPAMALRFPNGIPAVSDADQSAWMLYVYKQFERPSNATGVPLTISVLDSNGNFRTVGTTTSDSTGAYSFNWVPDVAGKYTVYVTFAGTGAYYAASAENAFVVNEAPAATTAPTQTSSTAADLYLLPGIIAIIIAIIVVGAVIILSLRKRP
jgi:hypothetical protein